MTKSNFLIMDGSSVLVRAYFATAYQGRIRQTASGQYTNAVMGFLNMTLGAIGQWRPSHLFVAWDVSRDTFRRELYPAYKGTRGELPDELLSQFDLMQEVLRSLGIAQHADERYEADDIIGTLADIASADHDVLVVTGDRDALQLVADRVSVAIMKKGMSEVQLYTPDTLREEHGLSAAQITDLKGLMGDTSDNIPGVPGIGEKTAKKLLSTYETVENLIANRHEVTGKLGEKLEQHQDLARLSKQLATIVRNVPINITPNDCVFKIDMEAAENTLGRLELHHTLEQLARTVRVS